MICTLTCNNYAFNEQYSKKSTRNTDIHVVLHLNRCTIEWLLSNDFISNQKFKWKSSILNLIILLENKLQNI